MCNGLYFGLCPMVVGNTICQSHFFHFINCISLLLSDPGIPMVPNVRILVKEVVETLLMWLWLMKIPTDDVDQANFFNFPKLSQLLSIFLSNSRHSLIFSTFLKLSQFCSTISNFPFVLNFAKAYPNFSQLDFNEISQVLDSTAWIRCAFGNVYDNGHPLVRLRLQQKLFVSQNCKSL